MGRTITIPTPPTDDETKLVRILLTNQDVIEMSGERSGNSRVFSLTPRMTRGFVDEIADAGRRARVSRPMQFTCTCPLRVRTSFNDTLT